MPLWEIPRKVGNMMRTGEWSPWSWTNGLHWVILT